MKSQVIRPGRPTHFTLILALALHLGCGNARPGGEKVISHREHRDGWIQMIGIDEADGPLKEFYEQMKGGWRPAVYAPPTGDAANIVKVHSLEPEGMRLAFAMSRYIQWSEKSLPWTVREMLNTVTSRANNCFYCVSSHAEFLRDATKDRELAANLKSDFRQAKLPVKERRMLEFVDKLTRSPWLMTETDVSNLREMEYSDLDILHITMGSSQYSYLNRVANGLGIRFEYKTDLPEFKIPLDGSAPDPQRVLSKAASTAGKSVAWIHSPDVADPEWQNGEPRNLFKALGENAPARDGLRKWREYQLRGTSSLSDRVRTQLGLFVSGLNQCEYSAQWFANKLRALGINEGERDRLAAGKLPDDQGLLEALMFKHAARLTRRSWTTTESDIQKLRDAGLEDRGILQLTMLCSYLNFENRVAAGLGVAPE